jgi:aspartate-semialdehyde dehydrogenase
MSNIRPSLDGIDVSAAGSLRLSAGMVSGGAGADIGRTHRYAMRLDDRFTLDAGVFGRSATSSSAVAASLGVADDRVYGDYREMATAESQRPDGMDLVVVATPNDSHFEIARAFLEAGSPWCATSPSPAIRRRRRGEGAARRAAHHHP